MKCNSDNHKGVETNNKKHSREKIKTKIGYADNNDWLITTI